MASLPLSFAELMFVLTIFLVKRSYSRSDGPYQHLESEEALSRSKIRTSLLFPSRYPFYHTTTTISDRSAQVPRSICHKNRLQRRLRCKAQLLRVPKAELSSLSSRHHLPATTFSSSSLLSLTRSLEPHKRIHPVYMSDFSALQLREEDVQEVSRLSFVFLDPITLAHDPLPSFLPSLSLSLRIYFRMG